MHKQYKYEIKSVSNNKIFVSQLYHIHRENQHLTSIFIQKKAR